MKRYKLLKDLPTFKAGQLAYISKTGNLIAGTPENQKTTETGFSFAYRIECSGNQLNLVLSTGNIKP